jgi:hypothetical protein
MSKSEKEVWVFTKQSADFDNAFKAAKLFNACPKGESLEDFFAENYIDFDINTNRH